MKHYPANKDSGIEWLGEIPEHWKILKNKLLFKAVSIKGNSNTELLSVYRDYGVIPRYSRDDNFNRPSEDLSNYKLVKQGFLAINKMKAWQGALGISECEGIVSPAYIVCKPISLFYGRYFHFLYRSRPYVQELDRLSHGIRPNQWDLRYEDFAQTIVLFPPIIEQQSIANYLDSKTHLIDTLIENKQKLIGLLKEQRAAIINQVVTKGLNPNVKLKDLGIEWLGEIPEHWELRKVGRSFNLIGSGTTPKSENIGYYENGTINWVITGDLNDGILDKTSKKITEKALDEYSTLKMYPVGTLLIAMYGATIGKISLMNFEGCVNQACCALSDSPYLSNEFSFYWFLANKQHIINMSFGGGQPNISQDVIWSLKIPTPPSSEQQAIIYHLDEQTTIMDESIEKRDKQIEHLKEYRTALISEVVTGKIDVRDSEEQEVRHS